MSCFSLSIFLILRAHLCRILIGACISMLFCAPIRFFFFLFGSRSQAFSEDGVYGNIAIILDHFPRVSQRYPPVEHAG